jgi:hypothetical protein
MFPYDSALLAAVDSTPRTVADVLGIMQTIDATCITGDGLKWFNGLYLQVTQAVAARIAIGGFSDGAWLAQLDLEFAKLYFGALKSFLSTQPTPECWQILFSSRNQTALARIQFAMAGINAHINHDLAEAIVNTCRITGTTPDHGGLHYADYTSLNSTLDNLVDTAKSELNVRLLGDELPPVSHLEDTLAAWSVSAAREAAWQNAEHLEAVQSIPALAVGFVDMLDGLTTVIGKTLLIPV